VSSILQDEPESVNHKKDFRFITTQLLMEVKVSSANTWQLQPEECFTFSVSQKWTEGKWHK
jgi:hypothetical protein